MSWMEEIEQRWSNTTRAPWSVWTRTDRDPSGHVALIDKTFIAGSGDLAAVMVDATAIASAPSDIARLVAEVKRLKKLETAVRDWKRGSFTGEQDIDNALATLDESEVRG